MSKTDRPRSSPARPARGKPSRPAGEGGTKLPRKTAADEGTARRALPSRTAGREDAERSPSRRPPVRKPSPPPESNPETSEPEYAEKLQKIAGLQAVTALFRRDPERVLRLYYGEQLKTAAGPFCSQMAKLHRPYRLLEDDELEKVAGTVLHGGIVAAVKPRAVGGLGADMLAGWARTRKPLVILDGIGNPNNLGAIARTMAFFGLQQLLLTDHPEQASLSDSAYRVAEGGLEYLDIARLPDPAKSLARLKQHYRIVGTVLDRKAEGIEALAGSRPIALVLGNEEKGLSRSTLAACDGVINLPALGPMQSLNVAATAAILIHHLATAQSRGRKPGAAETGDRRRPAPSRPARRKRPD
jgi:TrmH RNA methyltransferase